MVFYQREFRNLNIGAASRVAQATELPLASDSLPQEVWGEKP